MASFEFVTRHKDCGLDLPKYATPGSAGVDLAAVEDTVIPSYYSLMNSLQDKAKGDFFSLDQMAKLTKETHAKPTLISTGLKCCLSKDEYLKIVVRSSTPLKYWLILANGVGIIDRDYADNVDNEGHIYFQVINLSPYAIQLHKGDIIGQGIIKRYETVEGDEVAGLRTGGFGSTSEQRYPSYSLEQKEQLRKEGKI